MPKLSQRETLHRAFGVECREAPGAPTKIAGYAVVFNQVAYGEVIRPGAFTKTLQEQGDIKAYWSHDTGQILARTTNDTLTLRQDDTGLYVEITPNPDTTWGKNALAAVQRGDVSQMSFGFRIVNASSIVENGEEIFEIREVQLREVSPVAEPWYEGTSAGVREKGINRSCPCCGHEGEQRETPEPVADDHSTDSRGREIDLIELGI